MDLGVIQINTIFHKAKFCLVCVIFFLNDMHIHFRVRVSLNVALKVKGP